MTEFFFDHDYYCDVKWANILGDTGRYHPISGNIGQYWGDIGRYWTISGDIGQYRAISGNIGVISISVKSVMCLARPIQVVPGQLIF